MPFNESNYGPQGSGFGVQQGSTQAPLYGQAYNDNLSRYNTIMQGYQNTAQNYGGTATQINQGYGALAATAAGQGAVQQQQIASAGAQNLARNQQQLISSGMGNQAVLGGLNRQSAYDTEQQQLANQQQVQNNVSGLKAQQLGSMANTAGVYAGLNNQANAFGASMTNRPENPVQNTGYGYPSGSGSQPQSAGYGSLPSGSQLLHPVQQLAGAGGDAGGNYLGGGGYGAPMAAPYMGSGSGDPYARIAAGMGGDSGGLDYEASGGEGGGE